MPVLPPDEAVTLLQDRVQRLEAEIQELRREMEEASSQGVERLFLIETEYLVAMRAAERTWVAQLLGLIEKTPGLTRTWSAWHRRRSAEMRAEASARRGADPAARAAGAMGRKPRRKPRAR
jgi:hypothetical protein